MRKRTPFMLRMAPRALFTVFISCWLTSTSFAADSREPKTTLKQALEKAEKHVADEKLDVSRLFLSTIYRSELPKNPKQNCWTVVWAPKDLSFDDGELRVYIYDDGRVQDGGSA